YRPRRCARLYGVLDRWPHGLGFLVQFPRKHDRKPVYGRVDVLRERGTQKGLRPHFIRSEFDQVPVRGIATRPGVRVAAGDTAVLTQYPYAYSYLARHAVMPRPHALADVVGNAAPGLGIVHIERVLAGLASDDQGSRADRLARDAAANFAGQRLQPARYLLETTHANGHAVAQHGKSHYTPFLLNT